MLFVAFQPLLDLLSVCAVATELPGSLADSVLVCVVCVVLVGFAKMCSEIINFFFCLSSYILTLESYRVKN